LAVGDDEAGQADDRPFGERCDRPALRGRLDVDMPVGVLADASDVEPPRTAHPRVGHHRAGHDEPGEGGIRGRTEFGDHTVGIVQDGAGRLPEGTEGERDHRSPSRPSGR
jgi:hypothetical protein